MAEQLTPFPISDIDRTITPVENPSAAPPDNIVFINFQPEKNRQEALRRFGADTMSHILKDTKRNGDIQEIKPDWTEIASSEPMGMMEDEQGNIEVSFIQYWRGYRGDSMGAPQPGFDRPKGNGVEGETRNDETVRILVLCWSAMKQSVSSHYIPPRDFRNKIPEYESRRRSENGRKELEGIRAALGWPEKTDE